MTSYADIMFTPQVEAEQAAIGAKGKFASRYDAKQDEPLGENEAAFLTSRTSIYIASVNSGGWPYIQHRGGPAGFIKLLDPRTIGFADYRGNRQRQFEHRGPRVDFCDGLCPQGAPQAARTCHIG